MTLALNGSGIGHGIAIGYAHLAPHGEAGASQRRLGRDDIHFEIRRYLDAVETAVAQLHTIRTSIPAHIPADVVAFIDTYLLMLNDDAFKTGPVNHIRKGCNAEWALQIEQQSLESAFQEMQDPYLKTRIDDVNHVVARIQRILSLSDTRDDQPRLRSEQTVIIADDLSPADLLQFLQEQVAGIVLQGSTPASHTAILARSLGIPAVIGVTNALLLREGELLVLDARCHTLLAGLPESAVDWYRRQQREESSRDQAIRKHSRRPSVTLDGEPVTLRANIELPQDLTLARDLRAAGVGLFRTEFLYLAGAAPDEERQVQEYSQALQCMGRQPVTIRTLDIGADKQRPDTAISALGLRAIRLSLKEPALFKVQLRAILRAAVHGRARILLPMISTVTEILQVKRLLRECAVELAAAGLPHRSRLPLGAMVETPAAALTIAQLAPHVDFFSIGTNDLIQYSLAVDRTESSVDYLYDDCHPAILGLLQQIIRSSGKSAIPIAMCGEMAGDPFFTRFLLALGLREFSLHPHNLAEIKHIVRESRLSQLRRGLGAILRADTSLQARSAIRRLNQI